ncbi:MAG: hypothetical protein RL582_508 [Bacteroidota bacterium]|jgi:hypothetical protein
MQNNQITTTVSIEDVMQIKTIAKLDERELLLSLAAYVNELIMTNFERLVQLLYRIDVSEEKLKKLLRQNPESDAGIIIADLIIDRQKQKILINTEENFGFRFEESEEELL